LALLPACGLNIVGVDSSSTEAGPTDDAGVRAFDAARADQADGSVTSEGRDASVTVDSGIDAPGGVSCATPVESGFVIPKLVGPVTVDGNLDEWRCAYFVRVDKNNAKAFLVSDGATSKTLGNWLSFSVAYDENAVYFAIRLDDPTPGRGSATGDKIFNNDSVEAYLGGDDVFTGTYTKADHQFIMDWHGFVRAYNDGKDDTATLATLTSGMTHPTTTGYQFELRVPASAMQRPSLAARTKIGINVALSDSSGSAQQGWFAWYGQDEDDCDDDCFPNRSTKGFAQVELAP
jgi:hypothetical protein